MAMAVAHERAVEALAQLLYDRSDPLGIIFPWSQRLPMVRGPWVAAARERLATLRRPARVEPTPGALDPGPDSCPRVSERAVFGAYRKHNNGVRPLSLGTLTRETCLEPGLLISTLFDLIGRGLIGEMAMFTGFDAEPTFRLLAAGQAELADDEDAVRAAP